MLAAPLPPPPPTTLHLGKRMPVKKIDEQFLKFRNQLWPRLDDKLLWVQGKKVGYTQIPRTMPLILQIMDALSSGKPLSSVYLELWCRAFNHSFVILNKQTEMAFHAGFGGQRAVQTWVTRMRILENLKFIDIKPGPSGDLSYALIWNPYLTIKSHNENKTAGFPNDLYNGLLQRVIEVKATDLD